MNTPNPFPATNPSIKLATAGNKGTLCVLILDESGSMSSYQADTVGGVNSFINKQKEDKDDTKISIVIFEGGNVRNPFNSVPVQSMPKFTNAHYTPRGSTNLNDAVGRTVGQVSSMLESLPQEERPSIIFQIMTDGQENASREFTKEQVKALIDAAQASDWIFTFVGANIDAFAASSAYGISKNATSSYNLSNTGDTYGVMSESVTRMKGMRSMGLSNQAIYSSDTVFLDSDREKLGK